MPVIIRKTPAKTKVASTVTLSVQGQTTAASLAPEPQLPNPLPASFMSIAEAAAYASVSQQTIRRWIKSKTLRCHRAGKQWRIDPQAIVSLMIRSAHC